MENSLDGKPLARKLVDSFSAETVPQRAPGTPLLPPTPGFDSKPTFSYMSRTPGAALFAPSAGSAPEPVSPIAPRAVDMSWVMQDPSASPMAPAVLSSSQRSSSRVGALPVPPRIDSSHSVPVDASPLPPTSRLTPVGESHFAPICDREAMVCPDYGLADDFHALDCADTPKKRLKPCPDTPVKTPISARIRSMLDADLQYADLQGQARFGAAGPAPAMPAAPCICEERDGRPCGSPQCVQLPYPIQLAMSQRSSRSGRSGRSAQSNPILTIEPDADVGVPPVGPMPVEMDPAAGPMDLLPPARSDYVPPSPSPSRRPPVTTSVTGHRRTLSADNFSWPGLTSMAAPAIPRDSHLSVLSLAPPAGSPLRRPPSAINPFSPEALSESRTSGSSAQDYSLDEYESFLSEQRNRFEDEFEELQELGHGSFGVVWLVRKRTDGWRYAVKRSSRPMRGLADRRNRLKEVFALAACGDCRHIVRYYDAWFENENLYIQTEYCEGGSLRNLLDQHHKFSEAELRAIARQVGKGLHHMHSLNLVHLDIKPDNIYITSEGAYKIGDLGLVVRADSRDPVEGDSRYLCRELLNQEWADLPRADVFALGMSLYELARGVPLPSQGDEWHAIRDGHVSLPGYSEAFLALVKRMIAPDSTQRPSLAELLAHPLLCQSLQSTQLATDVRLAEQTAQRLRRELQQSQDEKRRMQREIENLKLRLQEMAMATGHVVDI